jgi:hypothetical protein
MLLPGITLNTTARFDAGARDPLPNQPQPRRVERRLLRMTVVVLQPCRE